MHRNPLPYIIAAQCLLSLPLCAQNTATAPVQKSTIKDISPSTKTTTLKVEDLPDTMKWEKAPDGIGEFLAYPNPAGQEEFVWGERRLLGTTQGLLYSDAKDQWRVASSLYKQSVRVAGEEQNLLWVELGYYGAQGLVALNRNLEIVRRLPEVKGRCVAIEPQGFWCLYGYQEGGFSGKRGKALVEYDSQGNEKRRFIPQEFKLVLEPPLTPAERKEKEGFFSTEKPNDSAIGWAAVEPDTIWISINNYTSIDPGDVPIRAGVAHLGKLNRRTGKFTSIPIDIPENKTGIGVRSMEQILNLPGYIQWLSDPSFEFTDIYQLDKATLKTTRVIRLQGSSYQFTTRGRNLWSYQDASRFRVYSRETLDVLTNWRNTVPPLNEFYLRPDNWVRYSPFWLGILGDDEDGIWLSAPFTKLIHVSDDGKSASYDVGSILNSTQSTLTPHAPAGQFLWTDDKRLIRMASDGATKQLLLDGRWPDTMATGESFVQLLTATKDRIWYYTSNTKQVQIVTLNPDLSNPREVELSLSSQGTLAIGNSLYGWSALGQLLRINGTTGQVDVIESWHLPKDESLTASRSKLRGRQKDAFALPDGRIAFRFSAEPIYSPHFGFGADAALGDKSHFFIYNPIKDTWQESNASLEVTPLSTGQKLYGYDFAQFYEWRGDNWTPLVKRPQPSFQYRNYRADKYSAPRIVSTEKYFYQETNLGLFRMPWAQVGGGQ